MKIKVKMKNEYLDEIRGFRLEMVYISTLFDNEVIADCVNQMHENCEKTK